MIKEIKQLLEKTDDRLDLPEMFTQEALDIKICFGLILQAYQLIFSWTGFQHSSNFEVNLNILHYVINFSGLSLFFDYNFYFCCVKILRYKIKFVQVK